MNELAIQSKLIEPGTLYFRCNICGGSSLTDITSLARENASCMLCGSNARLRAVIRTLSIELFGKNLALPELAVHKEITGLDMSGSDIYAGCLKEKFSYQNTYYHQEPLLDVAAKTLPSNKLESSNFVICSEVLEHVVPPVSRAFENIYKILKPGGVVILTVPYGFIPQTIEHFPELYDFNLIRTNDGYRLRNVTEKGAVQEFDHLIFHGGPGSTLEMRIFAETELLQHLHSVGFQDIKVHRTPDFRHGIWWPEPWSLPISARKAALAS